jgi:hypothetical protein
VEEHYACWPQILAEVGAEELPPLETAIAMLDRAAPTPPPAVLAALRPGLQGPAAAARIENKRDGGTENRDKRTPLTTFPQVRGAFVRGA